MAKTTGKTKDLKTEVTPTEDTPAPKPKVEKVKLTPEQRRERVQNAREQRVTDFFVPGGTVRTFDYIGEYDAPEGEKYVDITGNKGVHGFTIKDTVTGEEFHIGPTSLKKGVNVYGAIQGWETKREQRAKITAEEDPQAGLTDTPAEDDLADVALSDANA